MWSTLHWGKAEASKSSPNQRTLIVNVRTSHGSWGCCQVDFNSLFSSYLPHSPQTNYDCKQPLHHRRRDFSSHSQENKLWTGPSRWSSGQKPQNVWHGTLDFAPVPPRWQISLDGFMSWQPQAALLSGQTWDAGTTSNVNIQNIKAFQTSANSLTSWSTAGRSSALVELSLVIPCHATKEPFTAWGTFHVTSTVYSGIIRDPWPPTQSFWTFSRPSFLSAKWPHWGSK